jgi:hypothetical protein
MRRMNIINIELRAKDKQNFRGMKIISKNMLG